MSDSRVGNLKHAAMACGGDGIWDIALGAILLLFGSVLFLSWHSAWAAVVVFVLPLALIAKRSITAPRLREYETQFSATSSMGAAVWILVLVILMVAGILGFLIWMTRDMGLPEWILSFLPIVLPVMLALLSVVIMVTAGMMVGAVGRYFLYAAAMATGFLALLWEAMPDWIALAAPGVLMIAVGLGCVAHFIITHPMVPQEYGFRYRF